MWVRNAESNPPENGASVAPVLCRLFSQIHAGVWLIGYSGRPPRVAYCPPFHRGGGGMRKVLVATAALIALASPAIAADMRLPRYKAPPPVVPAWSWTGCFLGGHAGGLWATQKDWIVRTPGGAFYGQSLGEHDEHSFVGGAQVGCDYQFAGGFVIGVQGDDAWTNAEGSHDSARDRRCLSQQGPVAGKRDRPCRLRLGSLPRLRQERRRLGARRLLGDHDHPRDCLHGARDALGLDHRRGR